MVRTKLSILDGGIEGRFIRMSEFLVLVRLIQISSASGNVLDGLTASRYLIIVERPYVSSRW